MQECQKRAAGAEVHLEAELHKCQDACTSAVVANQKVAELRRQVDYLKAAEHNLKMECISAKRDATTAEQMSQQADRRLKVSLLMHRNCTHCTIPGVIKGA